MCAQANVDVLLVVQTWGDLYSRWGPQISHRFRVSLSMTLLVSLSDPSPFSTISLGFWLWSPLLLWQLAVHPKILLLRGDSIVKNVVIFWILLMALDFINGDRLVQMGRRGSLSFGSSGMRGGIYGSDVPQLEPRLSLRSKLKTPQPVATVDNLAAFSEWRTLRFRCLFVKTFLGCCSLCIEDAVPGYLLQQNRSFCGIVTEFLSLDFNAGPTSHLAKTCLVCPLLGFWISLSMLRVSTMINLWSPEGKEANPIRRIPKRDVKNPSNVDDWSTDAFSSSWVFSSISLERHSLRDDWKRVFPLWGGLLIYSIVWKPPGSMRVDHRSLLEEISLASYSARPGIANSPLHAPLA